MKTYNATLLVIVRDGKILLAKKKRGFGIGLWNGVGGKIEKGETVEEALVRETHEEIGITITKFEPVARLAFDEYVKGERANVLVYVYRATDFTGEPVESDEMTPQWFDLGKIPYDDMFPDDTFWLPRVLDGQKVRGLFKYDKDVNMGSMSVIDVDDLDEELFDVLDENGNFTGEIVGRNVAHEKGVWHRAVGLYIVNHKGEVLCQKRSATKKLWPGCWDFSCGGHVEAGELGQGTAIREAEEELGLIIDPRDVRYICDCRSDKVMGKIHDRHFNEFFVAFVDVNLKNIKLQETEVDEVKYIPYDEFYAMVHSRSPVLTSKWESHEALVRYIDKYEVKK